MKSFLPAWVSLLMMLLFACREHDATAFEKASGIPLPTGAKHQDTHDDGYFVKSSVFKVDSDKLKAFVRQHQFGKFNSENIPQFWGINNLEEKPSLDNLESFYFKNGYTGNLSWIYIADLRSSRLWTEIKYPGKPAY